MANTVVLKRSAVPGKVPSTGDLSLGELAANTYDGALFFKKSVSGTESIVSVATLAGTQTLSNKTLESPVVTGTLTVSGSVGTNGQILASTGTGLQWRTLNTGALSQLTDVAINAPAAQQVLKFNGSQWVNANNDAAVASAVFSAQAQSDLGTVSDLVIGISENLGLINELAYFVYDMGQLRLDGIVSLSNLDQSVKSDYIAYSIIFGF
jgi:hypothetical protein